MLSILSFKSYSQVQFGSVDTKKVLNFNSNYFTFSKPIEVTILGKKRKSTPTVLTMNGEKIYNASSAEVTKLPQRKKFDLSDYLFHAIKKDLELLPDGCYTLNRFNLVVDKQGRLAYFDFDTLKVVSENIKTFKAATNTTAEDLPTAIQTIFDNLNLTEGAAHSPRELLIPQETKRRIYYSLYKALKSCPDFEPGIVNNAPVPFLLQEKEYNFYVVKNTRLLCLK